MLLMSILRLSSMGLGLAALTVLAPVLAQSDPPPKKPEQAEPEKRLVQPAPSAKPGADPSSSPQSPSPAAAPATTAPPQAAKAPAASRASVDAPSDWQPRVAQKAEASVLASILPCGLRVLVAQDNSLPVAAVVLSVPSGTGDDPGRNPGLVHALAYALQMGNRELSPGAALDEVYDSGGYAEMAVGVGQTRFESLIPHWSLRGVLRVEADRFSNPTLSEPLWLKSLQYAAQDRRPPHGPHRPLRAVAYSNPALLHDGRVVLPALTKIPLPALAQYLVQHFRLNRSTLAVVSNKAPKKTLSLITKVFSKLDAVSQDVTAAPNIPATNKGTQTSTNNKNWFLRPVLANPKQQRLARTLCEYLKRKGSTAPAIACEYHESATHPLMQIPAPKSVQEQSPLRARLDALLAGQDADALLETTLRVQTEQLAKLSSPLTLARHLASLPTWKLGPSSPQSFELASLRGDLEPSSSSALSAQELISQLRQAGLLDLSTYRLAVAAPAPPKQKKKTD